MSLSHRHPRLTGAREEAAGGTPLLRALADRIICPQVARPAGIKVPIPDIANRERCRNPPCLAASDTLSQNGLPADQQRVDGVDRLEQRALVPVRRCAGRHQVEQYALVLAAMGMQSWIVPEGDLLVLQVGDRDAARAAFELAAYDRENRDPIAPVERPLPAMPSPETAIAFWAVLLFFFAAARHDAFSLDWLGRGAATSASMLGGEWWRAVTALFLHANSVHLLGNLVFGTVFLLLLAQLTGAGVAALSMVIAGAVGNVLSALVQSQQHSSIGASTAIFASLGMIAALQQSARHNKLVFRLRKWTPLGAGLALLVFLGFSGENTDIVAHVMGFASGLVAGLVLSRWGRTLVSDPRAQWICGGTAGLLVATAWMAAAVT